MRSTLQLCMRIRVIPASQIPASKLRLPSSSAQVVQGKPRRRGSPSAEVLLREVEKRGLELPANLRLEDYVPPKELYANISQGDRELVRPSD